MNSRRDFLKIAVLGHIGSMAEQPTLVVSRHSISLDTQEYKAVAGHHTVEAICQRDLHLQILDTLMEINVHVIVAEHAEQSFAQELLLNLSKHIEEYPKIFSDQVALLLSTDTAPLPIANHFPRIPNTPLHKNRYQKFYRSRARCHL